jgi:MarR family
MKSKTSNAFLELYGRFLRVERWSFLTNHARVLLCIARDPGVRLREVAAGLGITERSAHAIVAELTAAGYVVKHKHGRRNRYQIQAHLPLPEPASQALAIGDVLTVLVGEAATAGEPSDADTTQRRSHSPAAASSCRDLLPE